MNWPKPTKEFDVPVYSGRIYLYRTPEKYNQALEYLKEKPRDLITSAGTAMHLTNNKTGKSIFLVGWFNRELATLVHECGHLTFAILLHAGVDVKEGNNEAYCYLLDTLFSKLK